MASLPQEYPLVLLGILDELSSMRHWLSFQDLCRMVSTRFDLEHLVELRSLLFSAACHDSCFPATLFRDRVTTRGLGLSPIGVAADIVTIFNLIQMTGGAPDENRPTRLQPIHPVDQYARSTLPAADRLRFTGRDRIRTHSDSGGGPIDQSLLFPKSNYSAHKRGSLPPDPIALVSSPPARARAVSFDWPHNIPILAGGRAPGQAMQSIYLPLETDSESSTQDSLNGDTGPKGEPESGPSCVKKRDIFKKDFHNQPLIPQVTVNSESPSPRGQEVSNRSFELLPNPYPSPTAHRPPADRRAKHESLDDLQDSTYFGAGGIPEWPPQHLQPPRSQNPVLTDKSLSMDDRVGAGRSGLDYVVSHPSRSTPTLNPVGSLRGVGGGRPGERGLVASTGTQTDPPDPRRLRSLVHADRFSFMTSLDDPDMMCEDDISAIFRFLDDISMCGSTGVLHPQDGAGGGGGGGGGPVGQDTPEARRLRLGQLQRLFHSLESSGDDGVKASVYKLLLRMGQIERQLESLAEVKAEISQVLSALQRLDEKIQEPGPVTAKGGRWIGPPSVSMSTIGSPLLTPGSESSEPQPLSVSGHLVPGASGGNPDWNVSGGQSDVTDSQHDIKGGKGVKKGILSRRTSKSQGKSLEKSDVDPNQPSVSVSARDWTVSFSKNKDSKALHGRTGQMDQSNSTSNLLPPKHSHLVEQMFSAPLFGQRGAVSARGGTASGFTNDPRLSEGRGGRVWTVDERESRISPLDLQAQESLNPNNLEFWMEDIYTPGYDALLRRNKAHLRRAKACKLVALVATVITIILIIVIPICTMGS